MLTPIILINYHNLWKIPVTTYFELVVVVVVVVVVEGAVVVGVTVVVVDVVDVSMVGGAI